MGMRNLAPDAVLKVTRASEKFVRGQNGVLMQIGPDQAGYDHDDLGRARGLLIEGAGSNLLRYSASFSNALWQKDSGVVVQASAIAAPDGSLTASRVDLPGGAAGIYQQVSGLGTAQNYSFALWARAVSGNVSITLGGINGPSQNARMLGTTWQRIGVVEAASGTTRFPKINTAIGGAPGSILIWNAQLEAGVVATGDMISNGVPAARAADIVRLDTGAGSEWFARDKPAGSFVFDVETASAFAGIWRIVQLYSASLNDDHLDLGYDSSAGQLRLSLRKGGQQIVTQSLYGNLAPAMRYRIALAWQDDGIAVASRGAVLKSPGGFAMPRNFSNIIIGSYGGQGNAMNGCLRGVSYWPERLSDARLAALSAT